MTSIVSSNLEFDYSTAAAAAALSAAAYKSGSDLASLLLLQGWTPFSAPAGAYVPFDAGGGYAKPTPGLFDSPNAFALAASRQIGDSTQFAIAFRGTDDGADWFNANIPHFGFTDYYKVLRPLVEETLYAAFQYKIANPGSKVELLLTGHSLGGAAVQVALLDLLASRADDVYPEPAPEFATIPRLDVGDRLGQSAAAINRFGAVDWQVVVDTLLPDVRAFTFGAPKLGSLENAYAQLTADKELWLDFHLVKFEHSENATSFDPVPHVGAVVYGQPVRLNINDSLEDRYGSFGGSNTILHGMLGYQESILRFLSLRDGFDLFGDPQGPQLDSVDPVNNNSLLIQSESGGSYSLGGGNDVFVVNTSSQVSINTGTGRDSIVLRPFAGDVVIEGPQGERSDVLYLDTGFSGVSAITSIYADYSEVADDLILDFDTISSSVTVKNWFGANPYQLAGIYRIGTTLPATSDSFRLDQPIAYKLPTIEATLPLFNTSTPGADRIVGSMGADLISGGAGRDTIRGRGGDDIINGDGDNDELYGGLGIDTLYGGAGNDLLNGAAPDTGIPNTTDYLDGGSGNDTYLVDVQANGFAYVEIVDVSGDADQLKVVAFNADPVKTRFVFQDSTFFVEVHDSREVLLAKVKIATNGDLPVVETLQLTYKGFRLEAFDLPAKLESARAGISQSVQTIAVDDYLGNPSTTGFVAVGSSVSGNIETPNDRDWFQVNLLADRTYRFDLQGSASTSKTLADPYMTLRDAAGSILVPGTAEDDAGAGLDARISYKAATSGSYFIGAGSSNLATGTGTYTLSVTQTAGPAASTNVAPTVAGAGKALAAGSVVSASTLFQASDANGDAIASYNILNDAGSGYFQLNGTKQAEGSGFNVTAAQFANLQYVVGSAGTSDTFVVKASDGQLLGPGQSITILGQAAAAAPVVLTAQNDAGSMVFGSQLVLNVLANDDTRLVRITDIQNEDDRYVSIRPGSQDAIVINAPMYYTGAFSFTYQATDGKGASAMASVTVNITQPLVVNRAPVVQNLQHTVPAGQQDIIDLLLFSSDPDSDPLTIHSYTSPGHGTLARNGNLLTYTPTAGFTGNDVFSYVIQDSHGAQATGTFTATVVQALQARDDTIATAMNAPVEFNVLQNDQYAAGSSLFFLFAPPYTEPRPPHGTLSYSQDGRMTYTPDAGFTGVDTFTYRVSYLGTGASSTGNIIVTVGGTGQQGGDGADMLSGTADADALFGNGGADTLWGGAGNDILDGGAGFDIVSFIGAPSRITVTLRQPYTDSFGAVQWSDPTFWSNDGLGSRDSVRNMEGVIGSEFGDEIEGNDVANLVYGNGGDDSISGRGGNDTVYGGDGNDLIQSGANIGGAGAYAFYGGNGNDYLSGNTSADSMDGGAGNDSIDGWGGLDALFGRDGNDRLRGTGTLDGGDGDDSLFVSNVQTADIIASRLIGGNGNDYLQGGTFNDTLEGGSGNDTLTGGQGSDRLDGGDGFDLVEYKAELTGIVADLATGYVQTASGLDAIVSIESIYGSWNAADRISGSESAEVIYGDLGNDTLNGRGGADTIDGGTNDDWIEGGGGADLLTGGAGRDRFVWSGDGDMGDTVTDFSVGASGDSLDMAGLFSASGYGGSTPWAAGYLRLMASTAGTWVQFDPDGSTGSAGFSNVALLQGVTPTGLVAANFSQTVDLAAMVAAMPVSLSIAVQSAVQKPGSGEAAVHEGNSGTTPVVIRFTREGNIAGSLSATVSFETGAGVSAGDFAGGLPAGGTIVFAAGQATYDLTINVAGDTLLEGDEKLAVSITAPGALGAASASLWILTEENLIDGNGALLGTNGADTILSHGLPDFILADSGDDRVSTGAGANYVNAGDGNDSVEGGADSDTFEGGAGSDTLAGLAGNDVLDGGLGNDSIVGGTGYDSAVFGGSRAGSTITRGAGTVTVVGADGTDTLTGIEKLIFIDGVLQLRAAGPDYNGDGKTDLLWRHNVNGGNTIWGSADSAQTQAVSAIADVDWKAAGTADFSGDGKTDILWRNSITGAAIIWNSADSGTPQGITAIADQSWKVAATGDFDADGKADILWRNSTNGAAIIWKGADSGASQAISTIADTAWKLAATGDFDADGSTDLLWRNSTTGASIIWKGANSGTTQDITTIADATWKLTGVGDFNGDGKSDLFWRNSTSGAAIIWNSAQSGQAVAVTTIADQSWKLIGTGDYDGDGKSDLLWRNANTNVAVIWKSADSAQVQAVTTVADNNWSLASYTNVTPEEVKPTVTYDISGDGKSDLLWYNTSNGLAVIWKSANQATAQDVTQLPVNWRIAGIADFNGDSKADILWRNTTDGAGAIWRSADSGQSQAISPIADSNWKIAGIGDFNADGKDDILWRNISTGANLIWNAGDSGQGRDVTQIADQSWKAAGIGDFNGDGKDDILWRNASNGAAVIWNGASSGDTQAISTIADTAWKLAAIADFNGDGKSDLLWRNSSTGANLIWKGADSGNTQDATTIANQDWQITSAADYTGDGKADIIWRNETDGGNVMWAEAQSGQATQLVTIVGSEWDNPQQLGRWLRADGNYFG